ncbi:MAG: peroxiredoxin-like family protein, partial [Bacteroidota bacterium]
MKNPQRSIESYKEGASKVNEAIDSLPDEPRNVIKKEADDLKAKYPANVLKLKVGDQAPDFTLKNAVGTTVGLYQLLKTNRVVLTFYRGTWCPYCNLQLTKYQEVIFKLKSMGSLMVAISPQTPDESLNMKEKNKLQFEVLSDPHNKVAGDYTTIIKKSSEFAGTISSMGKQFVEHYHDDSNEVPIPAVFIIDQDGSILFAQSEGGDYRDRVETDDVIDA